MPTQLKRRVVRRAPAPRKTKVEKLSRADVAFLSEKAEAYRQSEAAWQRLAAPPEEDGWSAVEEHLLARGSESSEKWKYFSR